MKNVNLDLLLDVVERLVPLLDEIVLVGGCATGLLVTDPGASSVRRPGMCFLMKAVKGEFRPCCHCLKNWDSSNRTHGISSPVFPAKS
jgi:hypothetical protein